MSSAAILSRRLFPILKWSKFHIPSLSFHTTSSDKVDLRQTAFHEFHVHHGGKMVPYAGWSMPVAYDLSITESALHTRSNAALFDVSHMLQMEVTGECAESFLETVSPADLVNLPEGSGTLSVYTNDQGGIIDDCIITRIGPKSFYVVSNAGCAEKDLKHLNEQLQLNFFGQDVHITVYEDRSLLALQGPRMKEVLSQGIRGDISSLYFMQSAEMEVFGIDNCRVTRCGYTGEDGVEISVPSASAVDLASKLIKFKEVKLAGLGTRDILRLEAGLCLYGNDINEETTPIEAGLAWCISGRRRETGGFNGHGTILAQLKNKPKRRRVGLLSKSKRPVRQGALVLDSNGNIVGEVTSGGPSPTLQSYIAMAYVPQALSKSGTKLKLQIRNTSLDTKIMKLPFTPSHYYLK